MATQSSRPLISLRHVSKGWKADKLHVPVLHDISLDVNPGETVAIVGPSGAGKSTLLHVMALLTPPDEGEIRFLDRHINTSEGWWDVRNRREIGIVFQDAKLLPNLSVMQNICVPLGHRGIWPSRQLVLANEVLTAVGLAHRKKHLPTQLSGGETMRTAIARALVTNPLLILADEPTGTLDSRTGETIAQLLFHTVTAERALVVITHHLPLAKRADRIIRLMDGRIEYA